MKRRTKGQVAEERAILLQEIRSIAPDLADALDDDERATIVDVRMVLADLYGSRNTATARAEARMRAERV